MTKAVKIEFTIAAAKDYDRDETTGHATPEWKYIDSAETCADALEKLNSVRDYPIVEFHIETTWDDGTRTRVEAFHPMEEILIDGRWIKRS